MVEMQFICGEGRCIFQGMHLADVTIDDVGHPMKYETDWSVYRNPTESQVEELPCLVGLAG
jgi:hypothetical protein